MVDPSWKIQGEAGADDLATANAFLALSALRGLPIILVDIAKSERVFFPENANDIEFVASKLDQLVTDLHRRLVAVEGFAPAVPRRKLGRRAKTRRRRRLADGSLGFPG